MRTEPLVMSGAEMGGPVRLDGEIVRAVLGGDRAAFGVLVDRYERAVKGTCWGVLRDEHLAQDATQDAFVTAYRNLPGLAEPGAFGPWILTIARRRAIRLLKQRRRMRVVAGEFETPSGETTETDDAVERVLRAMGRLPAHERVVVSLRYFDGQDVRTIAAVTGRAVGTITKTLTRAHERLRRLLEGARP